MEDPVSKEADSLHIFDSSEQSKKNIEEEDDSINQTKIENSLRTSFTKRGGSLVVNEFSESGCMKTKLAESNVELALIYYKSYCKMSDLSWLKSKLSEIGKTCFTFELYLLTLKKLAFLFFFLSVISIYPMYSCYLGKTLRVAELRFGWEKTSVSNLNIVIDAESFENNVLSLYSFLTTDSICCMVFLIFLWYLRYSNNKLLMIRIKENISIEDFCVNIYNMPPGKKRENNDANSQMNINLEDIPNEDDEFDRENNDNYKDLKFFIGEHYKQKEHINKLYLIVISKKHFLDSIEEIEKKIKVHKEELKNISEKNERKILIKKKITMLENEQVSLTEEYENYKNSPIVRYVAFLNTFEARQRLVSTFFYSSTRFLRFFCKKRGIKYFNRYGHESSIKIVAGDHPESTNWHNLVSAKKLFVNSVVTLFILLILIAVSYLAIYNLKTYTEPLAAKTDCKNINSQLSLEEAKKVYITDDDKYCYCRRQFFQSVFFDSDMNKYCESLYQDIVRSGGFRFSTGLGVWIISFLIQKCAIKILNFFMKHRSINNASMDILLILFILTIVNIGIVTVVINVKHKPFSREWYSTTGSSIMCTMIIGMVTSHMNCLISYIYKILYRKMCKSKIHFQSTLNKLYYANFDIGKRCSLVLSVVCLCFMFSSGMPFMNVICFFNMLSFYFFDKLALLKFYKTLNFENKLINERFILLLHFPLGIHVLLSYFSYTEKSVFPTKVLVVEKHSNEFDTYPIVVCCLTLGFFTALSFTLMYFKLNFLRNCVKKSMSVVEAAALNLDEYLQASNQFLVKQCKQDKLSNCIQPKMELNDNEECKENGKELENLEGVGTAK